MPDQNRLVLFSAAALSAVLITGCAMRTPVPELPEEDVPDRWVGPVEEEATIWGEQDWWNNFNNEELSEIIAGVQENNLDLANNRRNLEAAQITLREAGFNLLPTPVVDVGTGSSYSESNVDGVDSGGETDSSAELGGSFTYNDILSKPVNYDQAEADYDARVAQVQNVSLNTLGTASSTYFQLLLTRDKIEAARQNVANAEEIGEIANARVEAGVAVPIDALQQQIAIERERATLRSLIQNELAARSSLALLMGRSVQEFIVEGQTLENVGVPVVRPGVPAELLRRRPDLVQAEADLRSAAANVDVVRSDLLPQISLTGGANSTSGTLTNLLSSPDTFLNINANLVQTLLDNGRRSRNIQQARLNLENSLTDYRRTVLSAFNEIEVLLSNIQLLEQQRAVAERNLEAAEESFRIAQVRYEEGVADYQTVLQAQDTLFDSRNSVLDNKLQLLNAVVGLYQGLGGGWRMEDAGELQRD